MSSTVPAGWGGRGQGRGLRNGRTGGGAWVCGSSPSTGASSSSCSWARGSSCRRCAGVPEHRARARPGSTPCIASIRSKRSRAEPSFSAAATRAAPSSSASACPLSQSRAPPAGGSPGLRCSGGGSVTQVPTRLTRPLTEPSYQVPQVRWPRAVQAKQSLLHLQAVAHATAQGVVHSGQSRCNPKPQACPYSNLRRHSSVWPLPGVPRGLL